MASDQYNKTIRLLSRNINHPLRCVAKYRHPGYQIQFSHPMRTVRKWKIFFLTKDRTFLIPLALLSITTWKNSTQYFFKKKKKDIHLSGCIMSSPLLLPFRLLLWLPMKPNNPPPKMWEKISSMPPPPPLPSRRPCSPYLSYNSRFSGFDSTSYAKLISLNYYIKKKATRKTIRFSSRGVGERLLEPGTQLF